MKKTNLFKSLFYSLRVRVFILMCSVGIIVYLVVSILSSRSDQTSRVISRQFYLNELKILIIEQYFATQFELSQAEKDELEFRFELLLDKGPVFEFSSSYRNAEEKIAVDEFHKIYELTLEAYSNRTNPTKLVQLHMESLKYPSSDIYINTFTEISHRISRISIDKIIVLVTLFLVLFICYIVLQMVANRVGYMTKIAKKLINDDESLQLTERLNFKANDETIYIRDTMNRFLEKLEYYSLQLVNNTRGLVYQITQMFKASKGWTLETQVMRHSTERISRQMSEQIVSVNQSSATLEQMERTLDIIFNNISRQSAAMTQAATTLEEMGRQVDGVAQISSDTANFATRLTEVANKGNEAVENSIVSIKDVAEYSSQILKLLQLISGIAKQTNLLAMNASIEAAHAGESGRGFAIVAEEIRRLSETTNKNAKEIRTVVDTMVEKIGNSVEQARIAGEDLQQINTYSDNVAERIGQLNNMMQQQNVATHEMITTIEGLVNLAQEIKLSMEEQQFGLRDYSNTIRELKENFGEVKSTLDGHMSSVNNLLVILTDMGVRIGIQKRIMDSVGEYLKVYKVNPKNQITDDVIEEVQEQLFLEEKANIKSNNSNIL